ncbi:MAG: transcriptional regulator [Burkholderiaceae bacterium]
MDEKAIDKAIRLLGGPVGAARALNVKCYQTVQHWRNAGVPLAKCVSIELATNGAVRCEDLRPDMAEYFAYLRGHREGDFRDAIATLPLVRAGHKAQEENPA